MRVRETRQRAENAPWTDRDIELPGRGRTSIREVHGPEGAPTLVLLHGLAATGRLNWFAALRALSERFRVIVVDHRGHGRGFGRTTSAWPIARTTPSPSPTTSASSR